MRARELLQQQHRHVIAAAKALAAIIDLAGIGFRIVDEFLHRIHRKIAPHAHHQRLARDHGNGPERHGVIAHGLVGELVEDEWRVGRDQQLIAIRFRARDIGGGDHAHGARFGLDDKGLAALALHHLADQPQLDFHAAARSGRREDADRPVRIGALRQTGAHTQRNAQSRQGGKTSGARHANNPDHLNPPPRCARVLKRQDRFPEFAPHDNNFLSFWKQAEQPRDPCKTSDLR